MKRFLFLFILIGLSLFVIAAEEEYIVGDDQAIFCEDVGYFCVERDSCSYDDDAGDRYYCAGTTRTCCKKETMESCSELSGKICPSDMVCNGLVQESLDTDFCCLAECQIPEPLYSECEENGISCYNSCNNDQGYWRANYECDEFGEVCCKYFPENNGEEFDFDFFVFENRGVFVGLILIMGFFLAGLLLKKYFPFSRRKFFVKSFVFTCFFATLSIAIKLFLQMIYIAHNRMRYIENIDFLLYFYLELLISFLIFFLFLNYYKERFSKIVRPSYNLGITFVFIYLFLIFSSFMKVFEGVINIDSPFILSIGGDFMDLVWFILNIALVFFTSSFVYWLNEKFK